MASKYNGDLKKWTNKNQDEWFDDWCTTLPSMEGKTVAVTGCTSGIGFITAEECGRKGAKVIMLNRQSSRAADAFSEIQNLVPGQKFVHIDCDLMSFESVKAAAAKVNEECQTSGLDVLVNNAGVMMMQDKVTEDGFDVQMQTNHLSHFLLTQQVLPSLSKAEKQRGEARVINVGSAAQKFSAGPKMNLLSPLPCFAKSLRPKNFEKHQDGKLGGNWQYPLLPMGPKMWRYGQSKLSNSVYTNAAHDRFQQQNVNIKSIFMEPGVSFNTPAEIKKQRLSPRRRSSLLSTSTNTGNTPVSGLAYFAFGMGKMNVKTASMGSIAAACEKDVASNSRFRPNRVHKFFLAGGFGFFYTWGPAVNRKFDSFSTNARNKNILWEKSLAATNQTEADWDVKRVSDAYENNLNSRDTAKIDTGAVVPLVVEEVTVTAQE